MLPLFLCKRVQGDTGDETAFTTKFCVEFRNKMRRFSKLYKLSRNGFGLPLREIRRLNRNHFNFYLNQFYLSSVTRGVVTQSPESKAHVSNVRVFRIELEFKSVGF